MILGPSPIATAAPPLALHGPAHVRVGERVHLSTNAGPLTLYYKPGTAARRRVAGQGADWFVTIRPGHTQAFTVRLRGVVVARLVYRNVA